jgi:GT2 family glycosyltransferase
MATNHEIPLVSLITIWYHASGDVTRYLDNLRAIRYPRVQPVFVVYAQPSHDVEQLQASAPSALILHPSANLGTAAGWNLATRTVLESTDAAYVGIWNVDVTLDSTCVDRLVEVMERDPRIGACQPLLFYSDDPGRVQMYGGSLSLRTGAGKHDFNGTKRLDLLPPLRDADYLDGGTTLIRSEVLRRVGGFDEKLFMYAEDCDLSVRIRHAGYRTVAVRDARAWHHHYENHGLMPRPFQVFYETRNRFYVISKHAGRGDWWAHVGRSFFGMPRQLAHFIRHRKPVLALAYLQGTVYGFLGRMGKQGWVD